MRDHVPCPNAGIGKCRKTTAPRMTQIRSAQTQLKTEDSRSSGQFKCAQCKWATRSHRAGLGRFLSIPCEVGLALPCYTRQGRAGQPLPSVLLHTRHMARLLLCTSSRSIPSCPSSDIRVSSSACSGRSSPSFRRLACRRPGTGPFRSRCPTRRRPPDRRCRQCASAARPSRPET